MKKLKFFTVLATLTAALFLTSCHKDNDPAPGENTPQFQLKTVTVPDAMSQSSDQGAQMTVTYLNMVNSLTSFADLMKHNKDVTIQHFKENGTHTETWEVHDNENNNYTVTLTITETSEKYSWKMTVDGILDGNAVHDFLFMEAVQYKDGSNNTFTVYNYENPGEVLFYLSWHESNGTAYMTFEVPNEMLFNIIVNSDGSGSIEVKDWDNGSYQLRFKANWDASGHGEWEEYANGELYDSGSW